MITRIKHDLARGSASGAVTPPILELEPSLGIPYVEVV